MIEFDRKSHEYRDGDKTLISVTQLLRKHGLSPDYSFVDPETLRKAAERGTLIHADIQLYVQAGEIGFSEELASFIEWWKKVYDHGAESEKMVWNDEVAGTVDLIYVDKTGKKIIADIKTTSTIHKDAVSWQLSVYNLLNGWDADEGQCIHFDKEGRLEAVFIPLKPKAEVERLIECEREGAPFERLGIIPTELLDVAQRAQQIIEEADRRKKEAERDLETVKDAIMKAMDDAGLLRYEDESIRINVIPESKRTSIDTARLKKELPDVAIEYSKETPVKESVRITLKGEKE